jgi:hypothetical protein
VPYTSVNRDGILSGRGTLPAALILRIADNGLSTVVHMHMLDADKLMSSIAEPSKDFDVHRKSSH